MTEIGERSSSFGGDRIETRLMDSIDRRGDKSSIFGLSNSGLIAIRDESVVSNLKP